VVVSGFKRACPDCQIWFMVPRANEDVFDRVQFGQSVRLIAHAQDGRSPLSIALAQQRNDLQIFSLLFFFFYENKHKILLRTGQPGSFWRKWVQRCQTRRFVADVDLA